MPAVTVPDFATLLADHIGSVPEAAIPAFLARLERTAADRYRIWARDKQHWFLQINRSAGPDFHPDILVNCLPVSR